MESLHEWHEFYLLVGTAAATVLALLFVAVSLGAGYLTSSHQAPTRTFMSPVVIHFTSVFFVAAVCLIPSHGPIFFSALIAAAAVLGIAVSAFTSVQVIRKDWTQYVPDRRRHDLRRNELRARGTCRRLACTDDREYPQRVGSHIVHGTTPR